MLNLTSWTLCLFDTWSLLELFIHEAMVFLHYFFTGINCSVISSAYYTSNKYFRSLFIRLHLGDPVFIWGSAFNGVIMLCSWARHLTLKVPLLTQVYKYRYQQTFRATWENAERNILSCISLIVRALWLVNFVGHILQYGPHPFPPARFQDKEI